MHLCASCKLLLQQLVGNALFQSTYIIIRNKYIFKFAVDQYNNAYSHIGIRYNMINCKSMLLLYRGTTRDVFVSIVSPFDQIEFVFKIIVLCPHL